jgi:hypothetical protein
MGENSPSNNGDLENDESSFRITISSNQINFKRFVENLPTAPL